MRGEPAHPGRYLGVISQIDAVESKRIGHPVDHSESRLVPLEHRFDLGASCVRERFVWPHVMEALLDRLGFDAESDQPTHDRSGLVLEIDPENVLTGLYPLLGR